MRGRPTCLRKEAKFWQVAWVRPKIVGAFDFYGRLYWRVNMTNDTVAGLKQNLTEALMGTLDRVVTADFDMFTFEHLWTSPLVLDPETAVPLSDTREHLFSVVYELVVWNKLSLKHNENAFRDILNPGSDTLQLFEHLLHTTSNVSIMELFPTVYPMIFNETIVAPDTEGSRTMRWGMDVRLTVLLIGALLDLVSRELFACDG